MKGRSMARNGRNPGGDVKDREKLHFGGEGLYVLSFLEKTPRVLRGL